MEPEEDLPDAPETGGIGEEEQYAEVKEPIRHGKTSKDIKQGQHLTREMQRETREGQEETKPKDQEIRNEIKRRAKSSSKPFYLGEAKAKALCSA